MTQYRECFFLRKSALPPRKKTMTHISIKKGSNFQKAYLNSLTALLNLPEDMSFQAKQCVEKKH